MKFKKLPGQRKLKEDFTYNLNTGSFLRYDGAFGYITKQGYSSILYEGETYLIHRLIWKWIYNEEPNIIDHINGDKLDNRLVNLRDVDRGINARNRSKQANNTSGFTGVVWNKKNNNWSACTKIKQKQIYIGTYSTPQKAKQARDEFIKEFYPDHFTDRHGI